MLWLLLNLALLLVLPWPAVLLPCVIVIGTAVLMAAPSPPPPPAH